MDLMKIAQDDTLTYMEKTAALVDGFAAGEITGEEADAIATEAGIALSDLESTYNIAHGASIEKTASENLPESLEKFASEDATYLEKCASLIDAVVADEISAEDADVLAKEAGLAGSDIEAIHLAAYGDGEETVLAKIASDDSKTYLEKCAQIADAFENGDITGEEADAVSEEIGIAPSDVLGVHAAAYGDIEKEAKFSFGKIVDSAKDIATGKQFKQGAGQVADAGKKKTAGEAFTNMGKNNPKKSKIYGEKAGKRFGEANELAAEGKKNKLIGGAKTTALYGGGAAALVAAGRASKGDNK